MKKIYATNKVEYRNLEDIAIVFDKYGNELAVGNTIGACQLWCAINGISGNDEEYIATGDIVDGYFEWDGGMNSIDEDYRLFDDDDIVYV